MKDSVAIGKVKLAIDRMAEKYPLHAGILARWHVEASTLTPTMGVGFDAASQRLRLYVAPDFVETLSLDVLAGVLHHEVNHVLFGHVYQIPAPDEDTEAMIIAQEVTVNEWVPEPLPDGVVLLSHYPFLKPNENTETRYRQLRGKVHDERRGGTSLPSGGGGKGNGQTHAQGGQGSGKAGTPDPKAGAQQGSGKAGGGDPESGARGGCGTLDSHETWGEIQANAEAAKAVADYDIASVWSLLPDGQRGKVPDEFKVSINEHCTGAGSEAGSFNSDLSGGQGRVPWQQVLRRYVGKAFRQRPMFGRPPRRYPHLVGIVPGKARHRDQPKVLAAIDTSISMSDGDLADISAELALMSRRFEVTVVECDTEIHAVYPFKPIKNVQGRGGTDLRPPLEPVFLKKLKADLVVYFTDGDGPAPEKAPRVPVIWCLTEDGVNGAGWGKVVSMGKRSINQGGADTGNP